MSKLQQCRASLQAPVFMFSIQMASTGPSNSSHFLSLVVSMANSRM